MKIFKFIYKFLDEHFIEVAETMYVLTIICLIILGIWGIVDRDNMNSCGCEKCSCHAEEQIIQEGE